MIRVLQVFTIMNRGGAETMIMNYYRNIDRAKVQFDFLVHRRDRGAFDDEIESLGGRIYRLMPIRPNTIPAYKKQVENFFNNHDEYGIIHGNCSESGVYIYEEASRRGVPVIIAHAHNSKAGWNLKAPVRFYWKHRMRRHITRMFSCGAESSRYLFGKTNAEKACILNNAIDTEKFAFNEEKRRKLRTELGIEGKFVVGHVGRFNAQKNHKFLLDIFSEICRKNPDTVLLLAGTGDLKESVEKKASHLNIRDRVKFLGVRSDIADLLNAFDIFLFPSLFEGLPVTLVEAQANGLRCIVSDRIPRECQVTDLVEFHSLKKSPEEWACNVLRYENSCEHKNMHDDIVGSGFDIKENAKWLEAYYLDEYGKYKK